MKAQNKALVGMLLYRPTLTKMRKIIDVLKEHDANSKTKISHLIYLGARNQLGDVGMITMEILEQKVIEAEKMLKAIKK